MPISSPRPLPVTSPIYSFHLAQMCRFSSSSSTSRLISQSHTVSSGPAKQLDEIFVWGHVCRFLPHGDNFNQRRQKGHFYGLADTKRKADRDRGSRSEGKSRIWNLLKCCVVTESIGYSWGTISALPLSLFPLFRWSKCRLELNQRKTTAMLARHHLTKVCKS